MHWGCACFSLSGRVEEVWCVTVGPESTLDMEGRILGNLGIEPLLVAIQPIQARQTLFPGLAMGSGLIATSQDTSTLSLQHPAELRTSPVSHAWTGRAESVVGKLFSRYTYSQLPPLSGLTWTAISLIVVYKKERPTSWIHPISLVMKESFLHHYHIIYFDNKKPKQQPGSGNK